MRFYNDAKGNWTTSRGAARQTADEQNSRPFFEVDIKPNKAGILEILNRNKVVDRSVFDQAGIEPPTDLVGQSDPTMTDSAMPQPDKPDHPLNHMAVMEFIENARPHQLLDVQFAAARRLLPLIQSVEREVKR